MIILDQIVWKAYAIHKLYLYWKEFAKHMASRMFLINSLLLYIHTQPAQLLKYCESSIAHFLSMHQCIELFANFLANSMKPAITKIAEFHRRWCTSIISLFPLSTWLGSLIHVINMKVQGAV